MIRNGESQDTSTWNSFVGSVLAAANTLLSDGLDPARRFGRRDTVGNY
jgi:hypothetical protein